MPHDVSLIATIAAAFGLALILGLLAMKLRLPPLVGYLLAGVVVSPATPGYVADVGLAGQLAEIGVMLLMFGVGLHFSLDDLMAVRRIAVPGAIVQIVVATLLGAGAAMLWGWSGGAAIVFGLCLSVASTVVLLRALEARGLLKSEQGRIAVGWLVVEDLVMVLVLVLLPALAPVLGAKSSAATAEFGGLALTVGLTLAKVSAFIALMLIGGRRAFPRLLWLVAKSGSRELFTLCVVAAAVGVAYGAAILFDVSFALGAFFAGMMMRESEFSHRAADESLPLREAFSVLFFVSVGMLFDPTILVSSPGKVAAVLAVILVGKTVAAIEAEGGSAFNDLFVPETAIALKQGAGRLIRDVHDRGVLVLCDMQSGTPWNVACEAAFSPHARPPVAVVAGVNFPMLLQTDEVMMACDVHHAAAHIIELALPTLVQAKRVDTAQTDDF